MGHQWEMALGAYSEGRLEDCVRLCGEVPEGQAPLGEPHHLQGVALLSLDRAEEAVIPFQRALALDPALAEAHGHLGMALRKLGRVQEAIACYLRALGMDPDHAESHNNLGNALNQVGRVDEAIAHFERALALRPGFAQACNNLGTALRKKGRLEAAVANYRRAVELRPGYPEAFNNLGNALQDLGRREEARACLDRALALRPAFPEAHNNLGNLLRDQGLLDPAEACFRKSLELRPDYAEAHNNLGAVLQGQGRLDEAMDCFRKALEWQPALPGAQSNALYAVHLHPDYDARAIGEAHRLWNAEHALPLGLGVAAHGNPPDPERRLRIGYVSPRFNRLPEGRFLLPLVREQNRDSFELFLYSDLREPDATTEKLKACADGWRDIAGLPDAEVAELIRRDGIDIAVDLMLHNAGNRLAVFARKPAPVQVTYLGYCSTTGLTAMDYRFSDPWFDPPDSDDSVYSERTWRLPATYWCYEPPVVLPPSPPPGKGALTFGSMNAFGKLSDATLALWCDLLVAVPEARLLMHALEGGPRRRVLGFLGKAGLESSRVEFLGHLPLPDYFKAYHRVDIALDPFPCAGGTTTCDALWMGVPVVTLAGGTALSRAGLSVLSILGLEELVARTPSAYVALAAGLTRDLPRLGELKSGLRARMEASRLMDAKAFAGDVDQAFRDMWRIWCAGKGLSS